MNTAHAPRSQQLWAKIRKSSRYYGQGDRDGLFEILIEIGDPAGYVVIGGPGGQYRLSDVHLYVVQGGEALRIT